MAGRLEAPTELAASLTYPFGHRPDLAVLRSQQDDDSIGFAEIGVDDEVTAILERRDGSFLLGHPHGISILDGDEIRDVRVLDLDRNAFTAVEECLVNLGQGCSGNDQLGVANAPCSAMEWTTAPGKTQSKL